MRNVLGSLALAVAASTAGAASACAPPPPGYVPPTDTERLQQFVRQSDIVYGVITRTAAANQPVTFKVLHVYKGARTRGETIQALLSYDYPEPACAGMMGAPPPKPAGAYGVVGFNDVRPVLTFVKPDDVQEMIRTGLIESARAR